MEFIDYYKTLEVDKNASEADIKKAYLRLARKLHPDLNPNDKEAHKKFQAINEELLSASAFCRHHHTELSFIYSLNEAGLIDVTVKDEELLLHTRQLKTLEQIIRMKQELDINLEGIETISYLLGQIHIMQQHIRQLNNRLAFYETE